MTITLEAKHLRAATGEATSVALGGREGAAPIFANVLIDEQDGGRVRFCATDLDTAIERFVTIASGELARKPVKTTVSAKFLAAIAAKLPGDAQVSLAQLDGAGLKVTAGRSKFTLATLRPEEFPDFPRDETVAQFEMPGSVLATLLDNVSFAIGTDETRYYLIGIYLHVVEHDGGKVLRAAATDGHRLARTQVKLPEGAETFPEAGIIVPRRSLKVLRALIDHNPGEEGSDASVAIGVSERRIEFTFGSGDYSTRYSTKLVDGTFPDYTRVIPTANDKLLKISKAELKEAVDRVATIATEKTRAVKMTATRDLVTLEVTSPEAGKAIEEVPADYDSAELSVGFNSKYLLDVLARVPGDTVVMELSDPAAPVLLRGADDADSLFVLMPMRV